MPLYDYKCTFCGTREEDVFLRSTQLDKLEICKICGNEMQRLFPKNTHVQIDSDWDSKPRASVVKERNEQLKKKHAGYSYEQKAMRDSINEKAANIYGKNEVR